MKNTRGFTFIELLVTVTIIAVLSAIAAVNFASTGQKSRDAKRKADLETIRSALELYRNDEGSYPQLTTASGCITSTTIASATVSYLAPIPKDPRDDGTHTYCYKYTGTGGVPYSGYTITSPIEVTSDSNYPLYSLTNP